jgi:hypothetical protein
MPGINAVVAAEDFLEKGVGARRQPGKGRGISKSLPALALGAPLRRHSSAESDEKHR